MVVHTTRYTTPSKSSPSSSRPIWTRYWKVASTEILYSASSILSVRLIVAPGKHRLDHVLDGRILHREVDDGHFRQQLGGHPGDLIARHPQRDAARVLRHHLTVGTQVDRQILRLDLQPALGGELLNQGRQFAVEQDAAVGDHDP